LSNRIGHEIGTEKNPEFSSCHLSGNPVLSIVSNNTRSHRERVSASTSPARMVLVC